MKKLFIIGFCMILLLPLSVIAVSPKVIGNQIETFASGVAGIGSTKVINEHQFATFRSSNGGLRVIYPGDNITTLFTPTNEGSGEIAINTSNVWIVKPDVAIIREYDWAGTATGKLISYGQWCGSSCNPAITMTPNSSHIYGLSTAMSNVGEVFRYDITNGSIETTALFDSGISTSNPNHYAIFHDGERIFILNTTHISQFDEEGNLIGDAFEHNKTAQSYYGMGGNSTHIYIGLSNGALTNIDFYGYELLSSLIPPTINIITPQSSTLYNNDPFDINYTSEGQNLATITANNLYVNGTLNATSTGNFSIDIGEGEYTLVVEAVDSDLLTTNATVTSVKIDRTNPFDNLLTVLPVGTVILENTTINVTAMNTNLFGHNVTVYDPLGEIFFSLEVLNISEPGHTINVPITPISMQTGTYTVVSNESDDHTKNKIKDYRVNHNISLGQLNFKSENDVSVIIKSAKKHIGKTKIEKKSKIKSLGHTKKEDRYEFGFEMQEAGTYTYELDVVADKVLTPRENSGYACHFVIDDTQWIDFEPYVCSYKMVTDTYAIVTIEATEVINFKSIGGTNFASTESSFIITAPTINETPSILCDYDLAGFTSCDNPTEGQELAQYQAKCNYGSALEFRLENVTGAELIFFASPGIETFEGVWERDETDITIGAGTLYNVSIICSNDNGIIEDSVLFTGQALETPVSMFDSLAGIIAGAGAVLLTALIIITVISGHIPRMKRRKK